jgi:hypothetical protein
VTNPLRCIRGCKDKADSYPHGDYCPRHARMMAPRIQWAELGVPYPEGQEPPPVPEPAKLTRPVRTVLGLGFWRNGDFLVDPLTVIYAPCPIGCGRPTCCLPGQAIPPCLGCEVTAHLSEENPS